MKAIGRNLVIKEIKEGTTKTKGGLLLAENQREDIRYIEANVVSVGNEVNGINENDKIFFFTRLIILYFNLIIYVLVSKNFYVSSKC